MAQVLVDRKAIRILQMLLKEKTAMLQGAHKDCAIIICQISYQTDVVAIVEKDATRCLTELVELLDDSDDSVSSTHYIYVLNIQFSEIFTICNMKTFVFTP